jgi:hypothetical protein
MIPLDRNGAQPILRRPYTIGLFPGFERPDVRISYKSD